MIVAVLCGQALADNLGDIRDEERDLWKLLGIPELPGDHPSRYSDSAWRHTRDRLREAREPLPEHLAGDEDEDEE